MALKAMACLTFVLLMLPHGHLDAVECCTHCGCQKIKKVTKLVKTLKEIEVPTYRYAKEETFYPDKRAVHHFGYHTETFFTPHVYWCGQESRVHHEVCEQVEHRVEKGRCKCHSECHEEKHHKEYVDYKTTWTRTGCVACETESGCKDLLGTSTCGCTKQTCVKKPSGEICVQLAPEVRWVTYHVCGECKHCWSPAEKDMLGAAYQTPNPAVADFASNIEPRSRAPMSLQRMRTFGGLLGRLGTQLERSVQSLTSR